MEELLPVDLNRLSSTMFTICHLQFPKGPLFPYVAFMIMHSDCLGGHNEFSLGKMVALQPYIRSLLYIHASICACR